MSNTVSLLLVDDEPRNLDALEAILGTQDYRLFRAHNADEALKRLLEEDVAAIVLDIKMPGTSGFELAQMIKGTRRFRQIPILFLTAYLVDDKDIIAGYGTGAVDYLTKPLNPEILRHKVAVYAELFRKTRALAELNERLEARVGERTAELEKSEAALRASNQKKDEFIAVLAHELRNPLTPLRFGLDVLARHAGPMSPRVEKTLGSMNRQLDHMVRLIDDLLDLSRINRGVIELKRARADLSQILQGVIESSRPLLDRHGHTLSVDVSGSVHVDGDGTRLSQIVSNLLHNAAKFTPHGGRIGLVLAVEGAEAVIRVSDSGIGIPPDQIERAFEMFARLDRTEGGGEAGLGIGLALSRRLTEMHGGSLQASSEGIGRGTTFTVRLPLSDRAEATPEEAADEPVQPRSRLNVVVIEDNDDIAETLSTLLESMGHVVAVAHDGIAGLALVGEKGPDIVLCDLGLPGLDGLEVCRRVRLLALAKQPIMVALTGWGRPDDRRRTTEVGFDAHLVKPVRAANLETLLRGATTS